MSTELESAKLFASYFNEDPDASTAAGGETVYAPPAEDEFEQIGFEATKWPGAMTVICALFYVLGVSGVVGGLYAMRNLANLEAAEILVGRMAQFSPEAKMQAAMLAAQVKYSGYMYLTLGLRVLVGVACFGAGSLMTKRFDGANNIAILVAGLAIFYNLVAIGVGYLTTTAALELPGIDKAGAEMATMIAIGVMGGFFLVKLGIYCGLAYYLSRPNICQIFKPKPKRRKRY